MEKLVQIISWMGTFYKTRQTALNDYKMYMSMCDPNSSEYAKYAANVHAINNGSYEVYE